MNDHRPIGIFDSGVGGLTVASKIKGLLPQEALIYFGDTAHLPYGDKSAHAIRSYIREISSFLKDQNCKGIVVACNSASSVLDEELVAEMKLPVFNVIDPVVNYVRNNHSLNKIGVIATRRTIRSKIYSTKIKKNSPDKEVVEIATPMLAAMIEEGFTDGPIANAVLKRYLNEVPQVDALILGCTHYPLVSAIIQDILGPNIKLIDAPELVALDIKDQLQAFEGQNNQQDKFFVSDLTASFQKTAQLFFGESISLSEHSLS